MTDHDTTESSVRSSQYLSSIRALLPAWTRSARRAVPVLVSHTITVTFVIGAAQSVTNWTAYLNVLLGAGAISAMTKRITADFTRWIDEYGLIGLVCLFRSHEYETEVAVEDDQQTLKVYECQRCGIRRKGRLPNDDGEECETA